MKSPVKLLLIIDCYKNPYAGTEGQLMKLLAELDREKYCATLVLLRDYYYQEDNRFPVPVDILNIGGMLSPRSWVTLFRYFVIMRREGYRLAHTFFYDASMICPPILKLLGYKVIVSRRDMGYWYTTGKLLWLRLNRWLVDRVIANSNAVKSVTVASEWYPESKVEVIYNGYQDNPIEMVKSQDSILYGDADFNIGIVANIRPVKRIEDAVRAMRRVHSVVPSAKLYIIGDGDPSALQAEAERYGLSDVVRFPGQSNDVAMLLPYLDAGILCSESEGLSNTLIEYCQAGLPVVCSDVGGNPEIVTHGKTGFLYEMGDVEALSAALIKLAEDADLRLAMGAAGRERVCEGFSLLRMIERHQELYRSVMSGE